MPVATTYPGVYIEEVPSGVRTIVGVATSITVFVGRALRGPLNDPVTINSFGDFERTFGGLHADYPMSYAVKDFYLNRGSKAIIVRLFRNPGAGDPFAKIAADTLKLEASSPGTWGQNLRVKVDNAGITDEIAKRYNPAFAKEDLFNLTILEVSPNNPKEAIRRETFRNLSVKEGPRRADRVLAEESELARVQSKNDGTPDLANAVPQVTAADADPTNPNADQTKVVAPAASVNSDPLNDGAYTTSKNDKTGIFALEKADLFNLLCIPPDTRGGTTSSAVYQAALQYCADRRAMLIVDPPANWKKASDARDGLGALSLSGTMARNAALYFPRVIESDPLREGQPDTFVPCGIIAGVMARTDTERGVWKAPAGIDAALNGIQGLAANLTDEENGMLNPLGINCLRSFPVTGRVVWGARTLRGADQLADEYKYIPVRRLALYIEESLYRGTQWAVFEPNDEPLWAQLRLNVGAFMQNLFRQGAFQGRSPREAYFVKCDKETTTENDINLGIVNVIVGFAPLKPAEFVIIKIQQIAGQTEV